MHNHKTIQGSHRGGARHSVHVRAPAAIRAPAPQTERPRGITARRTRSLNNKGNIVTRRTRGSEPELPVSATGGLHPAAALSAQACRLARRLHAALARGNGRTKRASQSIMQMQPMLTRDAVAGRGQTPFPLHCACAVGSRPMRPSPPQCVCTALILDIPSGIQTPPHSLQVTFALSLAPSLLVSACQVRGATSLLGLGGLI